MKTAGSVTSWLRALEDGVDDAARLLWERYESALHAVAHRRMGRMRTRDVMDEEDIVISAFAAICHAARRGQLTKIKTRNELWAFLVVAIHNKVGQREEYLDAARRDHRRTVRSADLAVDFDSRLERLTTGAPDPETAAMQAEAANELLSLLDDSEHQAVAVLRMLGYSNDEIAAEMGYSRRTIQRILSVIRTTWEQANQDGSSDS